MASTRLADLDKARESLADLPGVVALDLLDAETHPAGHHVLEAVVGPKYDRIPPRVLRAIAEADCGVRAVTTRGDPVHFVVEIT